MVEKISGFQLPNPLSQAMGGFGSMGFSGLNPLPANAVAPAPNVTYVIQAEGSREVVKSPQEAIALMQRLSLFSPTRSVTGR